MNCNKKIMKKVGVTCLCATVIANMLAMPAMAAGTSSDKDQKDENIYVNLDGDGSVSGVYVVNEYDLDGETDITDYGDYTSVKNLTSDDEITLSDGKVSVSAPAGKFYYQGNQRDNEIPWDISIKYELDGTECSAEDIAGATGKLKITLSVKKNGTAYEDFFDNYLMQGTVTLDTDKCTNIKADGATQANVGSDRQLLYNIMAG